MCFICDLRRRSGVTLEQHLTRTDHRRNVSYPSLMWNLGDAREALDGLNLSRIIEDQISVTPPGEFVVQTLESLGFIPVSERETEQQEDSTQPSVVVKEEEKVEEKEEEEEEEGEEEEEEKTVYICEYTDYESEDEEEFRTLHDGSLCHVDSTVLVDDAYYYEEDDDIVYLESGEWCLREKAIYLSDADGWFARDTTDYARCDRTDNYYLIDNMFCCECCDQWMHVDYLRDDNQCDECYEDNTKIDLFEFSQHPKILSHDAKAEWDFYKQPHENTLFLGIELEIEFPSSLRRSMFDITNKYLKNRHIWKHDGSLHSGAELVITPHTLQSLHEINFHDMFKEMIKLGARSYEPGTCGLHVHVNRDEINWQLERKIKIFLCENRREVIWFSQRAEDNFERWTHIPSHVNSGRWDSKYVAFNCEPDDTKEFRIFRGTLNYKRFKASLQWVDACVLFCKTHSRQALTWSNFRVFVERDEQYKVLANYLKGRQSCA